jgi:hypothetical protein
MPPVGFEPTISAGERPKTYVLDRTATGTGNYEITPRVNIVSDRLSNLFSCGAGDNTISLELIQGALVLLTGGVRACYAPVMSSVVRRVFPR